MGIDNILISQEEFIAWIIDKGEHEFFPIIFNPFGQKAYEVISDLEKTFYPYDENQELKFFLDGPMGMMNLGTARGRHDGLRITALFVVISLIPQDRPLFVLIKKNQYLKRRLKYLSEKYHLNLEKIGENIIGPNKNYLGTINKTKRDPLDSKLRHECFKRDNYKCMECGATNKEEILHCDHILPISQGGTDELSNLQTLCSKCNLAKSNKKWVGNNNETI